MLMQSLSVALVVNVLCCAVLVTLAMVALQDVRQDGSATPVPVAHEADPVRRPPGEGADQRGDPAQSSAVSPLADLHPSHRQARLAYDAGDAKRARDLAAALLRSQPENAVLANDLGVYHLALGERVAAERSFARAVAADADYARAHYNLGTLLLTEGQAAVAADALQRAVILHPFDYSAHYNLGLALMRSDQAEAALKVFRRAADLNRAASSAGAHHNMGVLLLRRGDYLRAIKAFREALYHEPSHHAARYNVALCLSRVDQPTAAANEYEKLLAIAPDHQRALINLAILALRDQDLAKAEGHLQRAVTLRPASASAHYHLGLCHLRLDRPRRAMTQFAEATLVRPDHASAWYNLALVRRRLGEDAAAAQAYERACALRPERARYHFHRALCLADLGRGEQAEAAYTATLQRQSDHRKAAYNRGLLRYRRGTYTAALEDFTIAQALRPNSFAEQYMIGLCLLKLDRPDEAVPLFEAALLGNEDVRAAYNLGLAQERSGDLSAAITSYRRALRLQPRHRSSLQRAARLCGDLGRMAEAQTFARRLAALEPETVPTPSKTSVTEAATRPAAADHQPEE